MADENETSAPIDVAKEEAPTEAPVTKKQRAPRRSKAEMEAAVASSPKVRGKRTPRAQSVQADGEKPVLANAKKPVGKGATRAKPIPRAATPAAPVPASDEMADLIQLEEENRRLRQTLAEKLRAENADLRRRLGV